MGKLTKLRIAVVDDHVLTRRMWANLLAAWPHGEVVLLATDGLDYEAQLATAGPVDLVIMDLLMPRRDGFETTAWIREHHPDTLVLAITFEPTHEQVHHALVAGANGVLGKDVELEEFYKAMESLRTTRHYVNELMMAQLKHVPDPGSPMALRKKAIAALTPQLLRFMKIYTREDEPTIEGTSDEMGIKPGTGEGYRKDIVERTGARTRTAMLKFLVRFGLVKLS